MINGLGTEEVVNRIDLARAAAGTEDA